MQWRDVEKNWNAYVARILTRWPGLGEGPVIAVDGDQDAFLALLAESKGNDRVTAQMELADWLMGEEPADVIMDASRDNARAQASAADIPAGEDALSDDRKFGAETQPATPMQRAS